MSSKLRLVVGKPPVYAEIVRVIGRPPEGACYTWGDIIYVGKPPPGMRSNLDDWLMEHEATHSRQQAIVGGPEAWWRMWLDDAEFRRHQELAAYRNQYRLAAGHLGRPDRRVLARRLARDLSGEMYGHIIKRSEALEAIMA